MSPTTYKLNTISCASRYPPQVFVPNNREDRICTQPQQKILTVKAINEKEIPQQVIRQLHPDKELDDKLIVVKHEPNQWILTGPLEMGNNEIVHVDMFGDSGAECCGIEEDWAKAEFDGDIQTTTQVAAIDTPGGIVESNRFVNLSFKRYDGVTWTTRFYLLPKKFSIKCWYLC